jgi:hypothetical protein
MRIVRILILGLEAVQLQFLNSLLGNAVSSRMGTKMQRKKKRQGDTG